MVQSKSQRNATMLLRTRFAPSPTGLLHVGHAFSALQSYQWAERHAAAWMLRIEDIDVTRCRPPFVAQILEDLRWLGLQWSGDVRVQSEHLQDYQQAIEQLRHLHLIYPCFCTRKQIQLEWQKMGGAPHAEDALELYAGTCRVLTSNEQQQRMQREPFAWRLNAPRAFQYVGEPLFWSDGVAQHEIQPDMMNDVVIARKDIGVSYHLAVVVDDALQGVSHVIRGEDLRASTAVHRLLQALLNLPSPIYHHHALMCDTTGQRLAKRHHAITLKSLHEAGVVAADLLAYLRQSGGRWGFSANQSPDCIARQLGTRE